MATAPSPVYRVGSGSQINAGRYPGGKFTGLQALADAVMSGGFSVPPAPSPPPAPSTGTPQPFTLTASGSGVLPFAIGYAMAQGHVPSGSSLSFTGATAKLTVLSTWPDGSARHGIIAGTYTSAGSAVTVTPTVATVAAGTALTGAAVQSAMGANTAVFDAGAFGSATFSGADFASPFKTHAATDGFIEAIYRKQIGSDAHLVAWLALRVWSSGAVEALPWVENGYFNVAGPTNKSATYSFTLGGSLKFSQAIDIPNHCRTPLLSGAALSWWLGTDPAVTAKLDASYLMATELVPTYDATVSPSAAIVTGLPSTFTPLQQGGYPASMGSAGYDPSIGILPEWDVLYLTTTANVSAAIQRNAYSAGRYGIHHRDETTNRVPRFSSYPTTVLGDGCAISSIGSSTTSTFTPTATGTLPADFAPSHMPSMGFMAYLITGRFYHLETMQFAVTANHFRSSTAPREDASGILQTWSATSTRGAAWGLRSLAQAVAMTPDSDTTIRTELLNAYAANISRHHATYVVGSNGSMGFMQPYTNYTASISQNAGAGSTSTSIVLPGGTTSTSGEYAKVFSNGGGWTITIGGETRNVTAWNGATFTATVSPAFTVATANQPSVLRSNHWYEASWQQDFYTAALGYAGCLQIGDSTTRTQWAAFFAWKARSIVGRFGGVSATEYLYRDAAAYEFPVAENDTTWANFYTDWGKVWTDAELQNARGSKVIGDGSLRGTTTDLSSYWGNLQPALAYAIRHGAYGAAEARALMESAPNWSALAATGNDYPVWAVKPLPLPAWRQSMARWEWKRLTGTSIANTPVAVQPAIGTAKNRVESWNGIVAIGRMVARAGVGGHADWAGNEGYVGNLGVDSPGPAILLRQPTPDAYVTSDTDYYAVEPDGKQRPTATHTYYTLHPDAIRNQVVRLGVAAGTGTGNWSSPNCDAFDIESKDWLAANTLADCPQSLYIGLSQCRDPSTGDVYVVGTVNLWRWNHADRSWTQLAALPQNGTAAGARASLVDRTRNRVVILGDAYRTAQQGVLIYNIGTNTWSTADMSGAYAAEITAATGNMAFHDAGLDKYIVKTNSAGNQVLLVDPATWASSALATTGGASMPTTLNGVFGLFQWMPALQGYVIEPRGNSDIWFLAAT